MGAVPELLGHLDIIAWTQEPGGDGVTDAADRQAERGGCRVEGLRE